MLWVKELENKDIKNKHFNCISSKYGDKRCFQSTCTWSLVSKEMTPASTSVRLPIWIDQHTVGTSSRNQNNPTFGHKQYFSEFTMVNSQVHTWNLTTVHFIRIATHDTNCYTHINIFTYQFFVGIITQFLWLVSETLDIWRCYNQYSCWNNK